jgi:DNA-binding transcriptional ArsR family regulator
MIKKVAYKHSQKYSLLLKALGHTPKLRIMDIFMTNPYFDFSKSELVKELGMSKQTLYKSFGDLEELGVVKVSRRIGRAVLYRINMQHPLVKQLHSMVTQTSLKIAEEEMARMKRPIKLRS